MLDLTLVSEARHGLLFKVIPTVNHDHGEMAAHFHIVATHAPQNSAPPNMRGANDWQNTQISSTRRRLSLQQELHDPFSLHVAAKHAPIHEQMGTVRLAVQGRAAHQEHNKLIHAIDHGFHAANHLPRLTRASSIISFARWVAQTLSPG